MLIDVGGCSNAQEAAQHLSSTFQDPTRFWESNQIDISLGSLELSEDDAEEFASIITERGVNPRTVFSDLEATRVALAGVNVTARDTTAVDCTPTSKPRKGTEMVISIAVPGGQPDTWHPSTPVALSDIIDAEEVIGSDDDEEDDEEDNMDPELTPHVPLPTVPPRGTSVEEATASTQAETTDASGTTTTTTKGTKKKKSSAKTAASTAATSAETAPKAAAAAPAQPAVLFLRMTLRSGQTINHKGHLVIVGDVNPGAEVIAEGDIVIWGALRGIAHAGSAGNEASEIRALRLQPIQLRIAHAIARAPDRPRGKPSTPGPELARVVDGQIRISYNAPE